MPRGVAGRCSLLLSALLLVACGGEITGGGAADGGGQGGAGGQAGAGGSGNGDAGGAGGGGGAADAGAGSDGKDDGGGKADAGSDAASSGMDTELQYCVDEINRYRAMLGRTPYKRSSTLESFAAEGAKIDGTAHSPHKHFMTTGGGGVAYAENEIPWWRLSSYGTIHAIITGGLKAMWAEGPGSGSAHGHYVNMSSTMYTTVGCGIFVNGDEVTVTQDFK